MMNAAMPKIITNHTMHILKGRTTSKDRSATYLVTEHSAVRYLWDTAAEVWVRSRFVGREFSINALGSIAAAVQY